MPDTNSNVQSTKKCFYSFNIDYPETKAGRVSWNANYSLNAYYAGKHWNIRKSDAQYWHALVMEAIGRKKSKVEVCETPVVIQFLFNDSLDCSNHAAMVKMIEDALKGIVIKDDSPKYVKGIYIGFHDKPFISVSVFKTT